MLRFLEAIVFTYPAEDKVILFPMVLLFSILPVMNYITHWWQKVVWLKK